MSTIKFEVQGIENAEGSGEERPYIRLHNGKALTLDELASRINEASTVTKADVKAVMAELRHFAIEELSAGRRFYLPDVGYLWLSVGNTPPALKADGKLTGKDIYVRKVNFRVEKDFLQEVRRRVHFEKSKYTTRSARYGEDDLWTKVEAYLQVHRYLSVSTMASAFGLSRYIARKWLTRFTDQGRLTKEGTPKNPLYFLTGI